MKNCIIIPTTREIERNTSNIPWALSTCFFSPASLSNSRPNSRPRDPQRRNPQRWCDNHRHGLLEVATGAPEKPTRHGPSANHSSGFEPVTKLNWSTRSDRAGFFQCQVETGRQRQWRSCPWRHLPHPAALPMSTHQHGSLWRCLTLFGSTGSTPATYIHLHLDHQADFARRIKRA